MTLAERAPSGAPRSAGIARHFVMVNLETVDAVGLDAALVFDRIRWRCERTGSWEATLADVQAELHLSEHRTKGALKVLRDRGWIVGERADRLRAVLTWRVVWEVEDSSVSGSSVAPPLEVEDSSVSSLEDVENKDTPLPPQGGEVLPGLIMSVQDVEADFAEWWSHYPRKDDRKPALRAYRTARKRASAQTLLDGLLAHLPAYTAMKADPDRRGFVPLASTWLNKERWLNEPPEPRTARRGAFDFTPEEMADIEARVASYGGQR